MTPHTTTLAAETILHDMGMWDRLYWIVLGIIVVLSFMGADNPFARIGRAIMGAISWTVIWFILLIAGLLIGQLAVSHDKHFPDKPAPSATHRPTSSPTS